MSDIIAPIGSDAYYARIRQDQRTFYWYIFIIFALLLTFTFLGLYVSPYFYIGDGVTLLLAFIIYAVTAYRRYLRVKALNATIPGYIGSRI